MRCGDVWNMYDVVSIVVDDIHRDHDFGDRVDEGWCKSTGRRSVERMNKGLNVSTKCWSSILCKSLRWAYMYVV